MSVKFVDRIVVWRKPVITAGVYSFEYSVMCQGKRHPVQADWAEAKIAAGEVILRNGRLSRPPVTEAERLANFEKLRNP